ncbi:MAG TPA: hypothetical protein VFQ43_03000 [Nitrososphaera sp.]|nr:hypothetical protein [Nitrososphaera sp.]
MPRVGEEYSPLVPTDQLIQKIELIPPVHGLWEGIDQALPDFLFHIGFLRIPGY